MVAIDLRRIAAGLYTLDVKPAPNGAGPLARVYYLLAQGDGSDAPLPLAHSWGDDDEALSGWYLITDGEIADNKTATFVAAARTNLNPPPPGGRGLAWIQAPDAWTKTSAPTVAQAVLSAPTSGGYVPNRNGGFRFLWPGGIGVTMGDQAQVSLQTDGGPPRLRFLVTVGSDQFSINARIGNVNFFPPDSQSPIWAIDVPLIGPQTGAICVQTRFDPGALYRTFGGGFGMFRSAADNSVTAFSYPFFQWVAPSPQLGDAIGLFAFLHPLFPENDSQTRFALDLTGTSQASDNSRKLHAPYYKTVGGQQAGFVIDPATGPAPLRNEEPAIAFPPEAPGFAIAKGPDRTGSQFNSYMTPVGSYELAVPDAGNLRLICGFSGAEFIHTAGGAKTRLMLHAGHPAHADDKTGTGAGQPSGLDDTYTTAWSVIASGPSAVSQGGYFAQPVASAYYGGPLSRDASYPFAVGALLNPLAAATPFPLLPYGGVFAATGDDAQDQTGPPEINLDPAEIQAFENSVVATARHQALTRAAPGPKFLQLDKLEPVDTRAVSPQGLLIDLNPDGSWKTLTLAKGPVDPNQSLNFGPVTQPDGQATVDPAVAKVLMNSQLVWVVSDFTKFADSAFQSEIDVGDFNFRLMPIDPAPDEPKSFLLFKFSTAKSVAEIMQTPAAWTDAATWVDDVDAVKSAFATLVEEAEATIGRSEDPFVTFRNQILIDPDWTGILSFNTQIDANGMPADLQMLFAGIDGQLTAHHFGIQINRISENDAAPSIAKSTLFGVIDYVGDCSGPGPQPPFTKTPGTGGCSELVDDSAYKFTVCDLIVVFANSVIADFHCQIKMNVAELFGRAVQLAGVPDNGIVINGKYQRHGMVGTVTFDVQKPFEFDTDTQDGALLRVIEKTVVQDATLVPITEGDGSQTKKAPGTPTTVRSRFKMSGGIFFARDPFATGDDVDIFSYGNGGAGLGFTELSLEICFALDAAGRREGETVIAFNAQAMRPAGPAAAMREGGLVSKLPIKLTGWMAAEKGLSKSDLGAHDVHVSQLADYTTSAPQYALVYELPLGSLGGQSELHANISAKLLVGWGPTATVPGNDGAAVLVQLPEASGGFKGFNLQGILKTVFGDANLMKVPYYDDFVWVMMFNNIQLSFLGIKLPPGVIVNFVLFADPASPRSSNLAWYLAAAQKPKDNAGGTDEQTGEGSDP